jgi:nucleotide-binding universal stress UspA family protein
MERILVGMDVSAASRHALEWAADMARRTEADLVAARVFVPAQAEISPADDVELHDRQRAELEHWCSPLPVAQPPTMLLLDGDPPDALLAAAHAQNADALVVGGRGAGGFLHLHIGSVAHHLAHHTTLPLAIVPRSAAAEVTHIVLGVDGSPGSLAAADLAADLASHLDVVVTAVYAFEPFAELVPESDPRSWHHHAQADARHWAAAVEKADVPLALDVDRDIHPVAAIARVLAAHPGSIACVGTRGLGGFNGLRLGRVPLQLVHHTDAAVIIVPPEGRG